MPEKSIEERLATIEEHIRNIDGNLKLKFTCRHITIDGECDFFASVVDHDRKINQWTGALATVALVCALIGSVIGAMLSRILK